MKPSVERVATTLFYDNMKMLMLRSKNVRQLLHGQRQGLLLNEA